MKVWISLSSVILAQIPWSWGVPPGWGCHGSEVLNDNCIEKPAWPDGSHSKLMNTGSFPPSPLVTKAPNRKNSCSLKGRLALCPSLCPVVLLWFLALQQSLALVLPGGSRAGWAGCCWSMPAVIWMQCFEQGRRKPNNPNGYILEIQISALWHLELVFFMHKLRSVLFC